MCALHWRSQTILGPLCPLRSPEGYRRIPNYVRSLSERFHLYWGEGRCRQRGRWAYVARIRETQGGQASPRRRLFFGKKHCWGVAVDLEMGSFIRGTFTYLLSAVRSGKSMAERALSDGGKYQSTVAGCNKLGGMGWNLGPFLQQGKPGARNAHPTRLARI